MQKLYETLVMVTAVVVVVHTVIVTVVICINVTGVRVVVTIVTVVKVAAQKGSSLTISPKGQIFRLAELNF